MKLGKGAKIAIASVTAAAVLGGGVFYFANRQPSKEVTVVPVSNIYTSYWGDSKTLDGYVTTGSMQEVRMTEGGFDKVAVKEGDTVRKGQTLVEYDNTQAELILRGDEAQINLLKSQIAAFEKQISDDHSMISTLKKKLESLSKPETKPEDGGSADTPAPAAKVKVMDEIDHLSDAFNYKADGSGADGTAEKPYRFDCVKPSAAKPTGTTVKIDMLKLSVPSDATTARAVFDIYDDALGTTWLARWEVDILTFPTLTTPEAWAVTAGLTIDKDSGAVTGFDPLQLKPYGKLTTVFPQDLMEKPDDTAPDDGLPDTKEDIEAEITRLYEDIDSCEKQIDTSGRDLRQAQITYEKNKLTQSAGKIVSSIDGTVATVGDASTPVGEVFLRVQGSSSYAVTLYVNELMLRDVAIGTTVQLMCYESGTMAPAVIAEIDPDPVTGYYSGGNPNASTYQVIAEITDPNAQPRLGEWCQATLDGQPADQPSDTLYLPLFVIREDDTGEYVMKADENDRLMKQYVVTGKSLWGSYVEIKSGATMEDRVAFPYGNTIKEGAPTVDADYFDY